MVDEIRAEAVERSTCILFSSLALALLFWQWRSMPVMVWQIDNPQIAAAAMGLSFLGWLIVLTSTFLINHFELFGLHQVASNLTGQAMPVPRFGTPLYYNFVRTGSISALSSRCGRHTCCRPWFFSREPPFLLTGVTSIPMKCGIGATMTIGHRLFAAVTTAYRDRHCAGGARPY